MRRTPAEGAGARVKDTPGTGLEISALLRLIGVMPHIEIPAQSRVFRGQRVKGGDIANLGQTALAALPIVVAGFEQNDIHAGFGKARRHRPAAGSGADNCVVASHYVVDRHTTSAKAPRTS